MTRFVIGPQLQADAFITLDASQAQVGRSVVTVAPFEALLQPDSGGS